jgi:hypothetical protein
MNLLLGALLQGVSELAREKGIKGYRVVYKRNARGELVIALIVEDKDGPLGVEKVPG